MSKIAFTTSKKVYPFQKHSNIYIRPAEAALEAAADAERPAEAARAAALAAALELVLNKREYDKINRLLLIY